MELDDLYGEYAQMIYRFIYLKCHDKELAEDITQTTFLKAVTRIDSFRGACKLSTWLCQIAQNEYRNECRRRGRTQSYDEYVEHSGERAAAQEAYVPDVMIEKIIRKEQADRVRSLIHSLKEPYKEVFMLRVYGEYSFGEIGELFQKNDTWARVTYYRAKAKILEAFKKEDPHEM
ncbi:MAG: RNA polymerase sigma factor [Muribaculum sp.]|nr:RNA polymerase sigma factor [Muribaculum sp.]